MDSKFTFNKTFTICNIVAIVGVCLTLFSYAKAQSDQIQDNTRSIEFVVTLEQERKERIEKDVDNIYKELDTINRKLDELIMSSRDSIR